MYRGEAARPCARVKEPSDYLGTVSLVERAAAPLLPLPPLPITSPPAAPIVDQLLRPSYKTINVYRGPRRPVT